MTALEKLNALQDGNIDKVLVSFGYHPRDFDLARDAYNAAKVEVTKVMLDEYLRTGDKTILQQLKESL